MTKASAISELRQEVPQGRVVFHRSFLVKLPRYCIGRKISRFFLLLTFNQLMHTVRCESGILWWEACTLPTELSRIQDNMLSTMKHSNLAQVKNLELFLSSCWLNLENILAVSRKTLLIIIATTRIVSSYCIARNFGRLFF